VALFVGFIYTGKFRILQNKGEQMVNKLFQNDLPADLKIEGDIAVDSETRGLNIFKRDRLCVVQIGDSKGNAYLVQFRNSEYDKAVNLKKLLADESRVKIFHFARFDVAAFKIFLKIDVRNIFCTKIASKLVRTYTDKHGLKELVKEFIDIDLSKQQQSSDWAAELSDKQVDYAASDVLYLHKLRERLAQMLKDEGRTELAKQCFDFLPTRIALDIGGWLEDDIFAH
jgi:ribonuclease D